MKKPILTDKEEEIFQMLKENNLYDEILNLGYILGREEVMEEVIQFNIVELKNLPQHKKLLNFLRCRASIVQNNKNNENTN